MTQNNAITRINQSPGAAEPEPEFHLFLVSLGACAEAVKVHGHQTLAEAWRTCERGDWMLWLCAKQVGEPGWPARKQLVLAACACATLTLDLFEARHRDDKRPRLAIKTARAWARSEATLEDVRAAADAAYTAADYAAYTAAVYVACAAYAAADDAYAAAVAYTVADYAAYTAAVYAACAAYAAACAVYAADAAYAAAAAAAYAADADAACYAANRKILLACADVCRKMLRIPSREESKSSYFSIDRCNCRR